jgi:hypothetical protein
VAPIMELAGDAPVWIRPGRVGSLGSAGAPAALRAAVARARGGGEDKGRWFALAGTDQSSLSQVIRARGSIAARDMA